MQSRTWISMLLLTGLFVVISTASNGQEAIGSTTSVKPQAEANTRTLSTGSSVYSKELIHTGDIGVANLRFHDNSNLNVGPKSSVRLDKFVYEPNKSAGSVAVEAARGSFRFATGAQSKGSYQVKTPYGTLGIRGWNVTRGWQTAVSRSATLSQLGDSSWKTENDVVLGRQQMCGPWSHSLGRKPAPARSQRSLSVLREQRAKMRLVWAFRLMLGFSTWITLSSIKGGADWLVFSFGILNDL
jgi:hypothetical protein